MIKKESLAYEATYKDAIKITGRSVSFKKDQAEITRYDWLLKDTLREIIKTHREEDGEVFEVNMAGWFNNSDGKMYMTLELSPRYRPAVQRTEKDMTLDEFFSEITEGQE